jgi:hypothetical protein
MDSFDVSQLFCLVSALFGEKSQLSALKFLTFGALN